MKRYLAILIIMILLMGGFAFAETPIVQSKSAILINVDTKEVLFEKNANQALAPASTTKMITALIIAENHTLNEKVDVGAVFQNPGGSHIAIDHGELFTVEQLLYALLLQSANDAAHALAVFHSGSEEAFAKEMNKKATELGAISSHFVNAYGLDSDGHVSTAHDLAIIGTAVMKNATLRQIIKTPKYTIPATNKKSEARDYIRTTNAFLANDGQKMTYKEKVVAIYDTRIDGVKTGYTDKALNCLVSSLTDNGTRYISVVLGAASKSMLYSESKALLEHAIEDFEKIRLISEGEVVTNIKVPGAESTGVNLIAAKTIMRTIPQNSEQQSNITKEISKYETKGKTIKMGTPLGLMTFKEKNKVIAKVELIAQRDIETRDLVGEISHALSTKKAFESPFDIAILVIKILFSLILWRLIVSKRRKRIAKRVRDEKLKSIRNEIHHKKTQKNSNVISINNKKKR